MPNKKEWVWKELGVYAETHTEYTKQPAVEKTWGWNPHITHFEVMQNMKTMQSKRKCCCIIFYCRIDQVHIKFLKEASARLQSS